MTQRALVTLSEPTSVSLLGRDIPPVRKTERERVALFSDGNRIVSQHFFCGVTHSDPPPHPSPPHKHHTVCLSLSVSLFLTLSVSVSVCLSLPSPPSIVVSSSF